MRRPLTGPCLTATALLITTSLTAPAAAYVQARDRVTHAPLRWGSSEVLLTLSARRTSQDLDAVAVTRALEQAAARWTREVGCDGLAIRVAPPSPAADRVRRDGVNAVVFHERTWARNGDADDARRGYDVEVQAMTTTYLDRDRARGVAWIAEADLELNGVHFRWLADDAPVRTRRDARLRDVLVHELGHVLGLSHDCNDGFLHPGAVDHRGRRPSPCAHGPARGSPAMSPDPTPASVPVLLAPDERHAVCDLYPGASPLKTLPGGRGCAVALAREGPKAGAVASILGALLVAQWRRGARRPCAGRSR
jgi:hypothetical protein